MKRNRCGFATAIDSALVPQSSLCGFLKEMVWPYFTAQAPYVFFPLQETVFTLVGALFIIYACWMLLAAPIWLISVLTNIVDGVVGSHVRPPTAHGQAAGLWG